MIRLGANMLTLGQFRQEMAEISRYACGAFRSVTTQDKLIPATECSSKRAVVNCQNRYPSPSMRSGLSRVRPHPFGASRIQGQSNARPFADSGLTPTFAIDFSASKALSLPKEAHWEGKKPCKHSNLRNFGFWLWSGLQRLPLVATLSLSKACLARARAQALRSLRALIRLQARLSALRAISSIATATHRAANNHLEFRAAQRGPLGLPVRAISQSSGQWTFAPLAFLPCRQGAFAPLAKT